jgi:octaprenyl-diphosphate synthase
MLAYVGDLGGKRLRPTLLLLSAKSLGDVTDEAIRLCVVVELVHTATLVHDDVLDNALMRRHKETVHTRWNVPSSVLVGDWLFTHAYSLANHGTSTIPGRWIADAAKQVCEGEMMQGKSIGHFDISIDEYVKLLDAKTGALCAVSCSLGAWSAGADENTCHALQQFGLKLGTAFQVFDDWLDVWGQAEDAGKTLGTDLASFKPTLPALRALGTMEPELRKSLIQRLNALEPDATVELRRVMEQSDASEFTKQFAMELVTGAIEHLDRLKPSEAVMALKSLANAAVRRTA